MKNSSDQMLINSVLKTCAQNSISHDNFVRAMLSLLYSDMRANGLTEHNLCDNDGVVLLNVRIM